MSSKNKIAIVTGASTGLGRSISVKLASHGYKIILISRNIKKLNQTFELIEKNGDNAKIIVADISCDRDVRKIYSQINLDEVEIIINNAGAVFAVRVGNCDRIPPRSAPLRIGTESIFCRNRTKSLLRFLWN